MNNFIMMCLAMGCLSSESTDAATIYRDRYLPAGAPCMIEYRKDQYINAQMVMQVQKAVFQYCSESNWNGCTWKSYDAVRITMINGSYYEYQTSDGNLDHLLYGVNARIEACRK